MKLALNVVLRLRQRREEAARQEFAQARRQAETIRGGLRKMEGTLSLQSRWARAALAQGESGDFAPYRELVGKVRSSVTGEMRRLAVAQAQLLEKRGVLIDAMKRRKAVERLGRRLASRVESRRRLQQAREMDDLHASHRASGMGSGAGGHDQAPEVAL